MATPTPKRYFKSKLKNDAAQDDKGKNAKSKDPDFADNTSFIEIKPNLQQRNKDRFKSFKHLEYKSKAKKEKYPGKMPIPKEKIEKYSKGKSSKGTGIKNKHHLQKFKKKEENIMFAVEQAARTEIILPEDVGYLEADEGELTTQFTQKQIVDSVDIAAAAKHFELHLKQFGPYRMRYSRNGRHLLLGGRMGHVAAFDWVTKQLHCELNVMESVHDVCWMHIEKMFAVAQKDWVYMYDHKGTEIHCLKNLHRVLRMEFLPYHFLLATGSELGFLSWLDISIGEIVNNFKTNIGRISIMKQNPYNAVLHVGQSKGIVSMWAPTVKSPLATMLCHNAPLTALAIDPRGTYMATAATDKTLKIWDVRKLEGPVQNYWLGSAPSQLELSHNNLLAVGTGNIVQVYKDCCTQRAKRPYLQHRMNAYVENMNFCPYEDVLGVATDRGFVSLLVPGSGEANFDTLESNPYESKSQRREAEVKALLEKIQPELISLDPLAVAEVNVPSLREKIEAHNKKKQLKPQKIILNPRRKGKLKGTAKRARNKKIIQETENRKFYKEMKNATTKKETEPKEEKSFGVLDRFIKKDKGRIKKF